MKKVRSIGWWLHSIFGYTAICLILAVVIFPVVWIGWFGMATLDVASSSWRGARLRSFDERTYISVVTHLREKSSSTDHLTASLEECYLHLLAHRKEYDLSKLRPVERQAFVKSVETAHKGYQQNQQKWGEDEVYQKLIEYFERQLHSDAP